MCASTRSTPPYWQDDLAGVIGAAPDGIMLPKPRSGEDVHTLSIALNHAEERAGAAVGATRIIAIATEVPVSLLSMPTYIGVELAAGGADLGRGGSVGRARLARNPRGRRPAGPRPIAWRAISRSSRRSPPACSRSTPSSSISAIAPGLREEARLAARDGFTAKMAIHPDQVADHQRGVHADPRGDRARRGHRAPVRRQPRRGRSCPSTARWSTVRTSSAPSACWRA